MAFVVHLHDDEILTILQLVGDIIVEGCESANMVSHMVAVHVDMRIVVHSTEIEQRAPLLRFELRTLNVELLIEPHRAFIEEQPLVARVPIGGQLHLFSLVEVIFYEVFRLLRFSVAEESPARRVHTIVVVAFLLHVNDVVPLAIERCGVSSQDVSYLRHLLCQRGKDGCCHEHDSCQ